MQMNTNTGGPPGKGEPAFKVKTSNTIQFMRQTSLTKIGGLLNSMNKNRQLQSQLSNPGEDKGVMNFLRNLCNCGVSVVKRA